MDDILAKRRLGRTDLWVTPIGLGGAWLGKDLKSGECEASPKGNDDRAVDTVIAALSGGINLIDTSPLYGDSERLVGLALAEWYRRGGRRADLVLSTKTGTRTRPFDYSGPATRRSVEESLRLLGTDHLDVVHVHDPGDLEPVLAPGGARDELRRMQTEGLVRAIGLGVRGHELHRRCMATGDFAVSLTYRDFNLVNASAVAGVLEPAIAHGVGVINAAVVMDGLLGGDDPFVVMGKDRPRGGYHPEDHEIALAHRLWRFCQSHRVDLLALNLQWCLRERRIASTLLGAASAAEIAHDLAALRRPISETVWSELADQFGL